MTHALPRGIRSLASPSGDCEGLLPSPAVYVSISGEKVLRAPRVRSRVSRHLGDMRMAGHTGGWLGDW
jgi:hypothetical protein